MIIRNLGTLILPIILCNLSCDSSGDKPNARTSEKILDGLKHRPGSALRQESEAQLIQLGTNIVPALITELRTVGIELGSKDTNIVIKALNNRHSLRGAFKIIGPQLQPFGSLFADELQNGKNPADAAFALAQMDDNYAIQIVYALTNHSSNVRLAAAGTIPSLSSNQFLIACATPFLIRLLDDENPTIRWVSAESLGYLKTLPEKSLPGLMSRVEQDTNPIVRIVSAGAISRYGTNAEIVKDRLQRLFESEKDARVKKSISSTLEIIEKNQ